MGHWISAVVADYPLVQKIAALSGSLYVAPLTEKLSIVGFSDEQLDALATNFNNPVAGFEYLSHELEGWLAEISMGGVLIYLETHYHGGAGSQGAALFRAGRPVWNRHENSDSPITRDSPINTALRELGVVAASRRDEFDTVGLSRLRSLCEFEQTAGQ